jgi:hypothetical protein
MPFTKKKYLKKKSLRKNKHRRTHKKRKTLIKRRKHSKKMYGSGNDVLTDEEIEEILGPFGSNMSETKRNEARTLLKKLKFDPTYTEDCFFSKLPKHRGDKLTLREQAESKVQCWFKYNEKIE